MRHRVVGRVPYAGCNLTIWDLGGKDELRSIQEHYFADSNAIVFVIDSADPGRFRECRRFLGAPLSIRCV